MKRLARACVILVLAGNLTGSTLAGQRSLAEVAREEAERRRALDEKGIKAKVITADSARVASPAERGLPALPSVPAVASRDRTPGSRASVGALRSALQKLDREIQYGRERLALLNARLETERWQIPKVGRNSRGSGGSSARERLAAQIKELEAKVKHWQRERFEIYESGRKAGFLPGELDGKGIIP
jgi:hypothetical protein